MTAGSDRHLSADSFAEYISEGLPMEHPVPGNPPIVLFFDPANHRVGLRGPASDGTPETGLENVIARTVVHHRQRLTEIAVIDPAYFPDSYPLLCAVADRAQLHGRTLTEALADTLRKFAHLLRPQDTLSREQETGLLGELCLVEAIQRAHGLVRALSCWRGPADEEHDFGFTGFDAEVKTTRSETRKHWIGSLTQMVPTQDRPLWLVSLQITEAGDGGLTLADLIARVRGTAHLPQLREHLDQSLRQAGWRERYAGQTLTSWRLRSTPQAYAVTGEFPRLTPQLLSIAGIDHSRLPDVRYQIDLTGIGASATPGPLSDLLKAISLESS